jgi:hypothetical protein
LQERRNAASAGRQRQRRRDNHFAAANYTPAPQWHTPHVSRQPGRHFAHRLRPRRPIKLQTALYSRRNIPFQTRAMGG